MTEIGRHAWHRAAVTVSRPVDGLAPTESWWVGKDRAQLKTAIAERQARMQNAKEARYVEGGERV